MFNRYLFIFLCLISSPVSASQTTLCGDILAITLAEPKYSESIAYHDQSALVAELKEPLEEFFLNRGTKKMSALQFKLNKEGDVVAASIHDPTKYGSDERLDLRELWLTLPRHLFRKYFQELNSFAQPFGGSLIQSEFRWVPSGMAESNQAAHADFSYLTASTAFWGAGTNLNRFGNDEVIGETSVGMTVIFTGDLHPNGGVWHSRPETGTQGRLVAISSFD